MSKDKCYFCGEVRDEHIGGKCPDISESSLNELLSLGLPRVAISIKQPWASLIVHGGKDVENRSWRTKFRGPVLIHASKKKDVRECQAFLELKEEREISFEQKGELCWDEIPSGGIVGVTEIVDCVTRSDSPWFAGEYGFILRNTRPLPFFPCRGALSFWKCNYPQHLLEG